MLDHAQEISGQKRRENLIRYREQALLSRSLVKLDDRVPLELDWLPARTRRVDRDALESLCQEFGFRRLAERVLGAVPSAAATAQRWEVHYHTVATLDELRGLVAQMQQQPLVAFDTETTSTCPRFAELVGCSFGWREGEAYYVPLRAPEGEVPLDCRTALEILRPALEGDPAPEGRTESEVRPDRPAQLRRRVARHAIRYDGGRLPTGTGATQPYAR